MAAAVGASEGSENSSSTPDTPTESSAEAFPWGDNGSTSNGYNESTLLDPAIIPPRVNVLPLTPEARSLHTLLRDRNTDQEAFIFYAERLMRPVCEFAYRLLPYEVNSRRLLACSLLTNV